MEGKRLTRNHTKGQSGDQLAALSDSLVQTSFIELLLCVRPYARQ